MKRIVIVGGGGFGREMVCWADDLCRSDSDFQLGGVIDDDAECFADYPHYQSLYLGSIHDYSPASADVLAMAIGSPQTKLKIGDELIARGAKFLTFINPSVIIGRNVKIGEGSVICPGTIITTDITMGRFVSINVHCSIGHDVTIGDGCTLSSHVDLTGFVKVGRCAFFGTHACVLPSAKVGDNARVGAGSVVLKTAPADGTVMGVPAKQIC